MRINAAAGNKTLNIGIRARGSRRRVNLVQEVVDCMQRDILADNHAVGRKLPCEGKLCETFGVSRTVMREAMRTLTERGLIEVSQGQVARVREPDTAVVEDSLNTFLKRADYSPLALLEVRAPLEMEAVALAAVRATPDQIAELRQCLPPLLTSNTIKAQIAAELKFHETLASASGNPLFLVLHRSLTKLIVEWLVSGMMQAGGLDRDHPDFHTPIVDAIERRDPAGARSAMIAHYGNATGLAEQFIKLGKATDMPVEVLSRGVKAK